MFLKIYQITVGIFTQTLMLMLLKNCFNFVIITLAVGRSTHPKFCGFLWFQGTLRIQFIRNFLKKYIPLPSNSLLRKLTKSPSTDNCQALQRLRDTNCIGNDIVILLDEMHLQPQVQFDGQTLIGCNADMVMYTSILCFMVVSLKTSIPFVISAIPLVKNSGEMVYQNINKCISLLTQSQFRVRAIISDNHTTNVKAYNLLLTNYKYQDKNYKITNPILSDQNIYLLFDTFHLIKNIRNNLLSRRFFDIPAFKFISGNFSISFHPGFVQWSHLHTIHERDLNLSAYLHAAYKTTTYVHLQYYICTSRK